MQCQLLDLWVGLFILLSAAAQLFLALKAGHMNTLSCGRRYHVTTRFDNAGGLKPGATVKSASMVVGRVDRIGLNGKIFQPEVGMKMHSGYQFPKDSSAKILTSGVLGEQYIGHKLGGDTNNLASNDRITTMHSVIVLETLISQFPFSKAAEEKEEQKQ
jgi:phospholipid/cholesterol/gamma-HCH transport system substrate-binding protein